MPTDVHASGSNLGASSKLALDAPLEGAVVPQRDAPHRPLSAFKLREGTDSGIKSKSTNGSREILATTAASKAKEGGLETEGLRDGLPVKTAQKVHKINKELSSLTDRSSSARTELEKLSELTAQIREQCSLQEKECATLDTEQEKLKTEIITIMDRISELEQTKAKSEAKLKKLREENEQLDRWLQKYDNEIIAAEKFAN